MDERRAASLLEYVLRTAQLRTNVCSFQDWDTGYSLPMRTVPDYNFIFVTRGKVTWEIDGRANVLTAGNLVLVRPGVPHRAWSNTREITLLSVHVELLLPVGRDAMLLLSPPERVEVPVGSKLDGYLRGAQEEYRGRPEVQARQMLSGWSQLITYEFLRHCSAQGLLKENPLTPVVAEVLEYIQEHRAEDIDLPGLARLSGYTAQHLNRLFKRELGTTPLKQLMLLRMQDARQMLDEGKLTVSAIARKCGFADPAYFSRVFAKQFGLSPVQYQRSSENPRGDSA